MRNLKSLIPGMLIILYEVSLMSLWDPPHEMYVAAADC